MRIAFEITPSDLIAFNVYHYDHSEATRTVRIVNRYGASAVLAVLGVVLAGAYNRWELVFPALLSAALALIWSPWVTRRAMMRMLRKAYAGESAQGLTGRKRMELVDEGLLVYSAGEELHLPWAEILSIVTDGDQQRAYVYTDASLAHIIPLMGEIDGDAPAFVAALREEWLRASKSTDEA